MSRRPNDWTEVHGVKKSRGTVEEAPKYRGAALGKALLKAIAPQLLDGNGSPDMTVMFDGKTMPFMHLLRHQSHVDEHGVVHLSFHHSKQPWLEPLELHFDPRFGPVRRHIKTSRLTTLVVGYPRFGSKSIRTFIDPKGQEHEEVAA
jgi:hypothetical protein